MKLCIDCKHFVIDNVTRARMCGLSERSPVTGKPTKSADWMRQSYRPCGDNAVLFEKKSSRLRAILSPFIWSSSETRS